MKASRGFAWLPVLIVAGLVILGGGAYVLKNSSKLFPPGSQMQLQTQVQTVSYPEQSQQTTTSSKTAVKNPLAAGDITLDQILNSDGFKDGVRHGTEKGGLPVETINKKNVVFGDVDGDGNKEALVQVLWCSASCGTGIGVYKNDNGTILSAILPGAGSKAGYEYVNIQDGVIHILRSPWFDTPEPQTFQVKFVNGDLRTLDSVTGKYVSSDPKNYSLSIISPTGGEQYKVGSTVSVRWSAPGAAHDTETSIYLQKNNNGASLIGTTTNITGSFTWTIPASLDLGYTSLTDTNQPVYRFIVKVGTDVYSNRFRIVP